MNCSEKSRRLYKQSVALQANIFREIALSMSIPISLHATLEPTRISLSNNVDEVLRWIILIEGSARIGVSRSIADKKRAIFSLQNLVAGGTRSRLRLTRKNRVGKEAKETGAMSSSGIEPLEKLQAERGLETIRKLIENYFTDDMCRIFEIPPTGALYQNSMQVEEEMGIGREYLRLLSDMSRSTSFFKHISPLPAMGFVLYLSGVLCDAYRESDQGCSIEESFDPWGTARIHNFIAAFCEDACVSPGNNNSIGVYKEWNDFMIGKDTKVLESVDICLLRTTFSASMITAVVALLPFVESLSGDNVITALREASASIHHGSNWYKDVQVLKEYIKTGSWKYPFHVPLEDIRVIHDFGGAAEYLTTMLRTELLPVFGIVPRSQFARLRIRGVDDLCSEKMDSKMKDAVAKIEKDGRRLLDLAKSCTSFSEDGRKNIGGEYFTLSGIDDLMEFFEKALTFAIQLVEDMYDLMKRGDVSNFSEFRNDTMRILTLGCLSSDLSGTLTVLYEDYMSKEILCAFEESTGARAPRSTKHSGRRDRSPKGSDGRTRTGRERRAELGREIQ